MTIIPLPAFEDNYIWLIVNPATQSFICIDPGDARPVLNYAKQNQLSLTHLLITHHHEDHTGGINDLIKALPEVDVFGPADLRIPQINTPLKDEDIVPIDELCFKVLSIPGHTRTHIAYYEAKKAWLFCGDTLFSAGCGRVFDGTIEQLHQAIQRLKQLPDNTQIYCAHEYTLQNLNFAAMVDPVNEDIQSYILDLKQRPNPCSLPSSIALEKKINPFMRTLEPAVLTFAHAHGESSNDSLAIFKWLRELKNKA